MEETIKLFKKAIAGEVMASAFYSLASEVTKDDEARMVFLELSTMEDDHAQSLVNTFKKAKGAPDFDGQGYLNELIKKDSGVSVENSETVRNGSLEEVLQLAINMENVAKKVYDQLADEAIDPDLKKYCIELSAEEAAHALQLTNTLNSVGMDAEDRPGL